ncbi:lysozyme [Rouxiella badensis]|uniref:lysozyme n=1 Tax=Rouxiella badensis TaxID=1646377 RepID=UPI001D155624|nr:lysozyme [Rouxiella badensis]MCC3717960.1 lysozyme [Rouxiella badensis]MCC3730025.1 lysozyme [Rouxiella badensis]
MAMSPALRSKIVKLGGATAMTIAIALLGGPDGVEGQRSEPYRDVGGVWTVCSGITGPDVIPGHHYSDKECDALLDKHLVPVKKAVDSAVKVPIDNYTRAALYSFAYNVGVTSFKHSSLLRHLNAGDTARACNDLRQWVYVNKQRNRGLINRREIDRQVCLMGGA